MAVVANIVTSFVNALAFFMGMGFAISGVYMAVRAAGYHERYGEPGCFWYESNPYRNKAVFAVFVVLACVFLRTVVSDWLFSLMMEAVR